MRTPILTRHPCFSEDASKRFGRIHLPVAPKCNISCNYCSRRYDCANESRPGVTSEILLPEEAVERLEQALKAMPYISTVGIAGPGDSLANPEKTFHTLELVRSVSSSLHLCLSTNGLMLADYADELVRLKVGYVTVTVNGTDVSIAEKIYRWVRFRGKNYYGKEGARLLLERQREGLMKLKGKGIFLKINTLYIPGVNDSHIQTVARQAKEMGAHLVNIMPIIPAKGSAFENIKRPEQTEIKRMQEIVGRDIETMNHCRQCRSDAAGMLSDFGCRISDVGFKNQKTQIPNLKSFMITLVDTTLRDGEQAPGVAFTIDEKVEIAKALSAIGIQEIEAGTPVMGGNEVEAVKAIVDLDLPAKIFTWNRVLEKDIEASLSCGAKHLYISCPVSDIQIQKKIRKTRNWVKERFAKIIPALKKEGCYIACGIEDASRADLPFVLEVCELLQELQTDRIRICDTVGILTPFKAFEIIAHLKRHITIPLEIHTHNDFGMATANAIAGIKGGAEYVSVTVNGMGERAGNAALEEVVMALEKLEGIKTGVNTKMLKQLSLFVSGFSGRPIHPIKPIVGDMAFSHESGIHVDGVIKEPSNYEPFQPEEVGNRREFHIGKHTGPKTLEKLQYIVRAVK